MTKQRGEAAWQHTLKANNNGGKNQYPHLSSSNFFLSRGLNVLVLQRLPSSRPLFPKGVYCVSASQNRRSTEGKERRTRRGALAVRHKTRREISGGTVAPRSERSYVPAPFLRCSARLPLLWLKRLIPERREYGFSGNLTAFRCVSDRGQNSVSFATSCRLGEAWGGRASKRWIVFVAHAASELCSCFSVSPRFKSYNRYVQHKK